MKILQYSKFFLVLSVVLVLASIASIALFGLELGIEFTGGSILEVEYEGERPSADEVKVQVQDLELGYVSVQPVGEARMLLRTKDITTETHDAILESLGKGATELRFESIGSTIGSELRGQTIWIVVFGIVIILLYVMIAFRRITAPFHSWQYSIAAIIALMHDLIIPIGIIAVLGVTLDVQFTIPIVVALLTVLGYSINDTVVVFDRIRERVLSQETFDVQYLLNQSFWQTLPRNIATSITTLAVLSSILFFGGDTLHYFALTLIIGIIAGTYSSLFLAPSFLLWVVRRRQIRG